jgi:ABC-type transport system substrate-binding protein
LCAACASAPAAQTTSTTLAPTTTSAPTTTTGPPTFSDNATVTIAVNQLPTNFNPWTVAGSSQVTQMIMETVWPRVSVQNATLGVQVCTVTAGECPSSLLVSAEPVSLDPMTVVYQIASNAKWSDGVPVTGADFAYLRDEVVANSSELPSTAPIVGYEDIQSLSTSKDGKTVTVVFTRPYEDWQGLFSGLIPSHVAIAHGFVAAFSGSDLANLVSAGPYRISHVVPGREVVLGRNPHYWGTPGHIARIIFRLEPTEAATLKALQDGKVTVAQLPPGRAVRQVVNASTTLMAETSYTPELWQLAFNMNDAVVGALGVRQAITEALDRRQLLADTIGLQTGATGAASNRLFGVGIPGGVANDARYVAVDDVDAEAALVAAGYTYGSDGLALTSTGAPLVLHLVGPSDNPIIDSMEAQIQAELLQVGVEVDVRNQPLSRLVGTTLPRGNFQISIAPFSTNAFLSTSQALYVPAADIAPIAATTIPPGTTPETITGTNTSDAPAAAVASSVVSRDIFGLNDPTLQPLFAQAATELSPAAANDLYNEIDIQLWQDLPSVPLLQNPVTTVFSSSLDGLTPSETWASFMFDAQAWNWTLNPPPTVTTTSTVPTSP